MAILITLNREIDMADELRQLLERNLSDVWTMDTDHDMTMCSPQLAYHAWIRIKQEDVEKKQVTFAIVSSTQYKLTTSLYAVYHSRFAELLLTYFDKEIKDLEINPLLTDGIDVFSKE